MNLRRTAGPDPWSSRSLSIMRGTALLDLGSVVSVAQAPSNKLQAASLTRKNYRIIKEIESRNYENK